MESRLNPQIHPKGYPHMWTCILDLLLTNQIQSVVLDGISSNVCNIWCTSGLFPKALLISFLQLWYYPKSSRHHRERASVATFFKIFFNLRGIPPSAPSLSMCLLKTNTQINKVECCKVKSPQQPACPNCLALFLIPCILGWRYAERQRIAMCLCKIN